MTDKTPVACDQCRYKQASLDSREELISKLNAKIDDMASEIVSLQGKLDLGTATSKGLEKETIVKLQERDDEFRRNLERAEARVVQLMATLGENGIEPPVEKPYFWVGAGATGPRF